ncbi:hypothetical protein NDU88_003076 [Pleurodeles waltl]|uniref:Uncharacterized protein n=1 Tax=Pleurodeles waltl TaxID=8319 RepID=A0AAV7LEC3_PLEWA|nr:hypothetical protein NDU88_003076 [Pleurodeles waltl]
MLLARWGPSGTEPTLHGDGALSAPQRDAGQGGGCPPLCILPLCRHAWRGPVWAAPRGLRLCSRGRMGKPKKTRAPAGTMDAPDVPPKEQDTTFQALRQMEEDAWTWLHAKGLAQSAQPEDVEEGWSPHKVKLKRRTRLGIKPSLAQVVEERSHLLHETTRFVAVHPTTLSYQADTEAVQETRSDSVDSMLGPLLTPHSADDI